METINDRISARRHKLNLSQEELAKRIGITRVSVSKWESGLNQPKGRYLNQLASALGVTVEWLLTGKDVQAETDHFVNVEPAILGVHQIPVLSYVQAGQLTAVREIRDVDGSYEYVQADDDVGERAFGMRISGDSMTPEFGEGDLVIIDPDIEPVPGDYVAAKNGSLEATFKKYRPRGFNQDGVEYFELVPLNDDYAPIRSDMCDVVIIGTMVEHRKYRRKRR
ncbi:LexA family transcriptional repressor [Oceanimonas baumannii]|uniref:LexA family transcriptional repressor n=1 Tax=Oceanimonas baumannii TaxID=129578 RepID=A0A235CJL7_9GAMM|nr:S24 family peptidase [Oceanimonas baumannii]OYD24722.1 LexA family transcriptional repressor [Oceanimonas baumannii]TDW59469.1 SOS-response transcriptional repressor LexA [Oceanimonas baumannii]